MIVCHSLFQPPSLLVYIFKNGDLNRANFPYLQFPTARNETATSKGTRGERGRASHLSYSTTLYYQELKYPFNSQSFPTPASEHPPHSHSRIGHVPWTTSPSTVHSPLALPNRTRSLRSSLITRHTVRIHTPRVRRPRLRTAKQTRLGFSPSRPDSLYHPSHRCTATSLSPFLTHARVPSHPSPSAPITSFTPLCQSAATILTPRVSTPSLRLHALATLGNSLAAASAGIPGYTEMDGENECFD
jgi:hypothetical protein